ncbi:hypothetical protein Pla175_15180 [Pirellulimonas nuda]|uniref:RNA polymerase subunit sigma n=1 Tax=Pirellulimonas nuda TaxID=2528009 RepID=A0A518D9H7_9BACT|nr:hypothetical protein [Pirellulimonas nuda]QDU88147.1 hypothetical protein Pla175_15180 [Pirellulimonas nuda]
MSVVRTGSNKQFADNWENIFGGKKKAAKPAPAKSKTSAKKKAAKKKK